MEESYNTYNNVLSKMFRICHAMQVGFICISALLVEVHFLTWKILFMYRVKSSGPNIDPCATHLTTFWAHEVQVLYVSPN